MDNHKCTNGYTIQPLKSYAGWYVGTVDNDGFPNCRISENYYKTENECRRAIEDMTYNFRFCVENQFCSGGVCFGGDRG